jgi:transcriptional regulator with XRE-family HTH domain
VRPFLRLKFERFRHGLTQQALADRSGVPQVWISAFEIGRVVPTDEQLTALGQALGVHPARLLDPVRVQEDPEPDRAEPIVMSESARG